MRLRVVEGPSAGREFELAEGQRLRIGRNRSCQIRLAEDLAVSKVHCELLVERGRAWVLDLGSSGGTRINDRAVGGDRPSELRVGDELRLSELTALRLEHLRADPRAPTVDLRAASPGAAPPLIPKFRIEALISEGGMGSVYRGIHESTRGTVAIKVMKPDLLRLDPRAESTFLREIVTESKLDHPNIVRMLASGSVEGRLFYVMEYVRGPDLHDYVCREVGRALTPEEALAIVHPLLDAVEHAHDRGIVHRDIKPQNVLVASPLPAPSVKLADFGLAKSFLSVGLSLISITGQGKGTVGFMPPEQVVDAKHVGPEADIYALGATLFFLLTLDTPISMNERSWLTAIQKNEPRSPSEAGARVSPVLDRIVRRAVARDPAARFGSVAELREALRAGG